MRVSLISDGKVTETKGGFLSQVDLVLDLSNLTDLAQVLCNFHVAPGVFRDNIKKQDHLQSIDFLFLDFDTGEHSSESIHLQLLGVPHVIVASKSHLKDKQDGKGVIERFHVFIPLDASITNVELYKYAAKSFATTRQWKVDRACLEPARYLYKHPQTLFVWERGTPLSVEHFIKIQTMEKELAAFPPKFRKRNSGKAFDKSGTPIDIFKRTKAFERLQHNLTGDGSRYAESSHIIGVMIKCGLSETECCSLFDQYASYGVSFTRESVSRRFRNWT